jgi:hypothetical protein
LIRNQRRRRSGRCELVQRREEESFDAALLQERRERARRIRVLDRGRVRDARQPWRNAAPIDRDAPDSRDPVGSSSILLVKVDDIAAAVVNSGVPAP